MLIVSRLKDVPLIRWAWARTPSGMRNWVAGLAPELSEDERPPMYRLAGRAATRLRPDKGANLTGLTRFLETSRLILHVGEGVESLHHVDIWHPFCRAADPNLVLVLRSAPLFHRVAAVRPDINAIYVRTARQAEWVAACMSDGKAVLYDANVGNNIHFLRLAWLRHVFLGHGDSEKMASCGKHFRGHDEIWTAGRGHVDRFANSGIDYSSLRFRIVGRPQVRSLLDRLASAGEGHFLYLPTWEGYHEDQNYSSVRMVGGMLPRIAQEVRLPGIAKLHPSTGKRDHALRKAERHVIGQAVPGADCAIQAVDRSRPVADFMAGARFLIADVSSVVSDFLVTGRPIFLYVPAGGGVGLSSSSVPFASYCYVFSTPAELHDLLDQVIVHGDDTLRESRLAARDYFVDIEATRGMRFEAELRRLMDGSSDPADAIRLLVT